MNKKENELKGSLGCLDFPGGSNSKKKKLPAIQETQVQSLGQEEPLEKEIATHSYRWFILKFFSK